MIALIFFCAIGVLIANNNDETVSVVPPLTASSPTTKNMDFLSTKCPENIDHERDFYTHITSIDELLEWYLAWDLPGDDLPKELQEELFLRRHLRREANPGWFLFWDGVTGVRKFLSGER